MKTKKELKINKDVILYQAKNGAIELKADLKKETIWASQNQIAELFGVTPQNITIHLRNIYKEKELNEKATCKYSLQVQTEGNRQIKRNIKEYNLDVIIAVGYRINSLIGTRFRQWATKTLKEYLMKGYVFNKKQIQKNYKEFLKNVENIKNLLPEGISLDPQSILDLVKEFSATWIALDKYDKELLEPIGKTKKQINFASIELVKAIQEFKSELLRSGEATDIFAQEREVGSVDGILGNVLQAFSGKDLYETIEEKSAHLLYFMVKNHPFVDGNKRSGAFAFIWFLRKNKVKGLININPSALTAITLLIAESKPEKKEQMINLVTNFLDIKVK